MSCFFLGAAVTTAAAFAAPAADKVTQLPGYLPQPFDVYSGFLKVPGPFKQNVYDSLSIHYQFHASQGNPETDPIATWHQGGPGGSSIEVGLYTEMGYFNVDANGTYGEQQLLKGPFSVPYHDFCHAAPYRARPGRVLTVRRRRECWVQSTSTLGTTSRTCSTSSPRLAPAAALASQPASRKALPSTARGTTHRKRRLTRTRSPHSLPPSPSTRTTICTSQAQTRHILAHCQMPLDPISRRYTAGAV
jgi:hypothetical protein